jgi:hypothetical protein
MHFLRRHTFVLLSSLFPLSLSSANTSKQPNPSHCFQFISVGWYVIVRSSTTPPASLAPHCFSYRKRQTRRNSCTFLVAGEISPFLFTSLVSGKDKFPVFIMYRAGCHVSRICLVKGETYRSSYFLCLSHYFADSTVCRDHKDWVHKFLWRFR